MNREDIIRMAREAGLASYEWVPNVGDEDVLQELTRFAALVAAHEREQCAGVCDQMERDAKGIDCCKWPTPYDCAAAIRARGNT